MPQHMPAPIDRRLPRKERLAFMKQRRKESRLAGFKGRKPLTLDAANRFFEKRYGSDYEELITYLNKGHDWRPSTTETIRKALASLARDKKNYPNPLVLFPLRGALFNYYFARGILNELRLEGKGKGIRLATIVSLSANREDAEHELRKSVVEEQVKKILARNKGIGSVVVVDVAATGSTSDLLRKVFEEQGIETFRHEGKVHEHQHFWFGKEMAGPRNFFIKTVKGKIYPVSVLKKLKKPLRKEEVYPTIFQTPSDIKQPVPRQKIREMLFYLGRAYYRLSRLQAR